MRGLLTLFCALVPLCALADESVPRGAQVIAFETTPGKPMELAIRGEPAEKIVVRRQGTSVTLTIARNVGEEYESTSTGLVEADWRPLEALARKLLTWKPKATGEPGYDPSTSAFLVQLASGRNEQRWSQPVAALEAPLALAKALGKLAREKIAKPRLFYF
jgi:hypothetical protein